MLDARPMCEFAAVEPGKTYCYKPPYGMGDIDFYRWLRRLLDVGGVFHIPAPVATHAA
jgi:hypothetical protein